MTVIIAVAEEMIARVRDHVREIIVVLIHHDTVKESAAMITNVLIITDQTIEGIGKTEVSIRIIQKVK